MKSIFEREEYDAGTIIIASIIAILLGMFIGGAILMMMWNGIICALAGVGTMSYGQGMLLYLGIRLVWPTNPIFYSGKR